MSSASPFLLRVIKAGFFAFPPLVWGLWIWSPLGFWGCVYLALILELLPVLGLAQLAMADDEEPLPRVPVYLSSGALILILGWLALLIGTGELGRGFMGLDPSPVTSTLLWALATTLAIHALLLVFFLGRRAFGVRESRILGQLLPRTLPEKFLFGLLSLSAGVGEELAFRGFAVPALGLVSGSLWGGAILSSCAFGLLHGYQGWLGIARTGLMGFVMAASFLLSGSLWPAIIAHTALDLVAGLALGNTLLKEI